MAFYSNKSFVVFIEPTVPDVIILINKGMVKVATSKVVYKSRKQYISVKEKI